MPSGASKGMSLRTGVRRVKHLSIKQFWAQGVAQAYGITLRKVLREENRGADLLTHCVSEQMFDEGSEARIAPGDVCCVEMGCGAAECRGGCEWTPSPRMQSHMLAMS